MSKVSLRIYTREIEGMVEASQLNEAIAHCQHILRTYPMHVDTYRMLGKAFLEAKRYTDSADIFQRTLMVVPDDFVSHVGMSIIRDDEGKLDDAIWHMERAFEIQPSNSAIQGELKRLYGRRDGVEPPKIRLSRDALANMYSQGELFNQAIAEIRAVLADDPNRADLQVMLARAYFRAGKKVEAAEMAATLLKKYPYCLDALRVLVDVLPGTSQGENIQVYKHRLEMLDPYSAFVNGSVFAADLVGDSVVTVEKLDYHPGAMPAESQPDWASNLGIKLDNENRSEAGGGWMPPALPAQSAASNPPTTEPGAISGPAPSQDAVPEWMRSAGWQASSGQSQETPPTSDEMLGAESTAAEPLAAEPLAAADMPDWLKSMKPPEAIEEETAEAQEPAGALPAGEDDIPDWLKTMAPSQTEKSDIPVNPVQPEKQESGESGEIPDWLKTASPTKPEPVEKAFDAPSQEATIPTPPEAKMEDTDIPDWLKSMAPTDTGEPQPVINETSPEEIPAQPEQAAPIEQGDTPDWLKSMDEPAAAEPEPPATPIAEAPTMSEEPVRDGIEQVPDWLGSLEPAPQTSTEAIQNEPVPAAPEAPQNESVPAAEESFPDWLKSIAPASETPGIPVEELPEPAPETASDAGGFPAWLNSIPAAEETKSELEDTKPMKRVRPEGSTPAGPVIEPPVEQSAEEEEALPDWLADMGNESAGKQPTGMETTPPGAVFPVEEPASAQPAPVVPLPIKQPINDITPPVEPPPQKAAASVSDSQPFQPTGEAKPLDISDDALGWLESLAAKQGANPDELLTKPQERKEEMPDWLQETEATAQAQPVQEPPAPKSPYKPALETMPLEMPNVWPEFQKTDEPAATPQAPAAAEELPAENPVEQPPAQEPGTGPAHPVTIADDTMAWLESLAANQGAKPEELLTKAEDRAGATPEWIQNAASEEPETPPIPAETPAQQPTSVHPEEDITVTTWLSKLDQESKAEMPESTPPVEENIPAAKEELPDWLKDLEKPAAPEPVKNDADLPDWLKGETPAAPTEEPSVAGAPIAEPEPTPEEEISSWLDEPEQVAAQAERTAPEEWQPAEAELPAPEIEAALEQHGETPQGNAAIEAPENIKAEAPVETPKMETQPPKPATTPLIKGTGMLARIPLQNKDADPLSLAQQALESDQLPEAMKEYSKLIKRGKLLEEVIHDLREAVYRYPIDVSIWQTLGDAYMRSNRLQDALDAYTKAEELLR